MLKENKLLLQAKSASFSKKPRCCLDKNGYHFTCKPDMAIAMNLAKLLMI